MFIDINSFSSGRKSKIYSLCTWGTALDLGYGPPNSSIRLANLAPFILSDGTNSNMNISGVFHPFFDDLRIPQVKSKAGVS